jgi:hypothetical protein
LPEEEEAVSHQVNLFDPRQLAIGAVITTVALGGQIIASTRGSNHLLAKSLMTASLELSGRRFPQASAARSAP